MTWLSWTDSIGPIVIYIITFSLVDRDTLINSTNSDMLLAFVIFLTAEGTKDEEKFTDNMIIALELIFSKDLFILSYLAILWE